MVVCERCGSFRVVRGRSTLLGDLLSVLIRKRPVICCRCGWRARRSWTDRELEVRMEPQVGNWDGPAIDLTVLDKSIAPSGEALDKLEPRT